MNRRYRLRKNRDFQRVYRRGKRFGCPWMSLLMLQKQVPELKVGFSVSKKVGNSVTRSRVKRLMREAFREELPLLRQNFDYVFVAREQAAQADYHTIRRAEAQLLEKAGAYDRKVRR